MSAKVSPIECRRCTPVARAEVVESGDRWRDRQRAGGDNECVVLEKPHVVMARSERHAVPLGVDLAGDGVEP